jgi:hypothetical protein
MNLGPISENEFLYYDRYALPRAYIPARCFGVKNMDASEAHMTNEKKFSLGDACIESLTENEMKYCQQHLSTVYPIKILKDEGNKIFLENIKGPTIIVLNDNYYPGWEAIDRIAGDAITIKPANMTFRALILPEKRDYGITFQYKPEWLVLSFVIVAASFMCILLLFWFYVHLKPSILNR